jgi:BASS family bile acid:Na+ symporter
MNQAAVILLVETSIVLSVLALGLRGTLADAVSLFRHPADLIRAFLSMNIVMPLFALALAIMFNLHPAVKVALVALSVSPVPPLLPRKVVKAGSRENYSIGLLVGMAILSIVTIPVAMELFEKLIGVPLAMPPLAVAALVLRTVLVPLLIGIIVRRLAPLRAAGAIKPLSIWSSVLLLLGVVLVLFASARAIFSLIGNGTLLVLAGFVLIGLVVGYVFAGPEPEKKYVLALATSCRHPGLAVAIATANFPNQKLATPAIVLYLIVSGVITGIVISRRKRTGASPGQFEQPMAA